MSPPAVHDDAQSYANPSFRAMPGRLGSRAPLALNCLDERPMTILQAWPVSRRVNSFGAPSDDQTLIDRVAA
jgi:hypothetical protein